MKHTYQHYDKWDSENQDALMGRIVAGKDGQQVYRGPSSFQSLTKEGGAYLIAAPIMEEALRIIEQSVQGITKKVAQQGLKALKDARDLIDAHHRQDIAARRRA